MDTLMVEKLSHDTLAHLVVALVGMGLISPDDLDTAMAGNPSNEVKRDVDLYHALMCCGDHQSKSTGFICEYYREDAPDCWSMPAHKAWMERMLRDKATYQVDDIKRLAKGFRDVEEALAKYPSGYQRLIRENISRTIDLEIDKGQASVFDLSD
jgi:hypothetical protein